MTGKTCQICGANSGIYPLCKKHLEMKNEGLVYKSQTDNKWVLKSADANLPEYENKEGVCCICGKPAPNGRQCRECYYETLDYKDNIDKNRKPSHIRDWYYNLKNSIYRQKDFFKKQTNCNKLIALAIINRDYHGDDSLMSRVYNDINNLLKQEKPQETTDKNEPTSYDFQKNETSGEVRCLDGHWVENDLEKEIDDMLYQLRKPHVYAKKVNEITSRCVKSDWFIPILSDTKGIYIEFWGMDTPDYKKNKEEKIALYQEEELPLIQIYRKDVLADKVLVRDNLESEINKLEKELKKKR